MIRTRFTVLVLYLLASVLANVGHDHRAELFGEPLVHESSCYDDCAHFTGHDVLPADHPHDCLVCSFHHAHHGVVDCGVVPAGVVVGSVGVTATTSSASPCRIPFQGRAPPQV